MSSVYQFLKSVFVSWFIPPYSEVKTNTGPNTFTYLLKQFDEPPKAKTQDDIIRDYKIKETMAALEVNMLKMDPANEFRGVQIYMDNSGNKFLDWVPCVVRPEVIYCSYGKS